MTEQKHTPGPWTLCTHLESAGKDRACGCGYRGVIFGPSHDPAMAICQPGHDPAAKGEEGTEPQRYPREVELANARLIAASPDLLAALIPFTQRGLFEGWSPEEWNDMLENARAAITKATNTE